MNGYWNKVLDRRLTRRRAIMATSGTAAAAAGFLAACGGGDDDGSSAGTGGSGSGSSGLLAPIVERHGQGAARRYLQVRPQRRPDVQTPTCRATTSRTSGSSTASC